MLTLKQDNFVLAYIETGNATEAYRRAYDTKKMNEATINRSAKELLDNPKISARVAELRKPVVEQVQITLKSHLDKLAELRDQAEQDAKWTAAIQAEVARGKASGLYVDQVKHTGDVNNPVALLLQQIPAASSFQPIADDEDPDS
jgi:phage terminase small subunit